MEFIGSVYSSTWLLQPTLDVGNTRTNCTAWVADSTLGVVCAGSYLLPNSFQAIATIQLGHYALAT